MRLTLLAGLWGVVFPALAQAASDNAAPADSAEQQAQPIAGLIEMESPHSVDETIDRLERMARSRGLTVFTRIDHQAGARDVDLTLRPTTVVIFGNPAAGTPLMQCAQTIGIDLPMKALIREDAAGNTWFAYTDPHHIARRHGAADCAAVPRVAKKLDALAHAVVAP